MRLLLNIIKAPNTRWVEEENPSPPAVTGASPVDVAYREGEYNAVAPPQWETPDAWTEEMINKAEKQAEGIARESENKAVALMADAKKQADSLVKKAETESNALRDKAREEGFAEGRDRGYQEGMQAARDEVFFLLQKGQAEIDGLLRQAQVQRENMLNDAEPQLLRLSLSIAGKILGYEIDHNDSAFLSMVRQALSSVKAESAATLRVNPSEYVRFFKTREVNIHTPNGTIAASVINDPTVGYGGCLIETESGVVDAGVSAQIDQVARHFGLENEEKTE